MKKYWPSCCLLVLLILGISFIPSQAKSPQSAKGEESLSYRFVSSARDVSPVALTASDGTGLALKLYQAKTVVQGPLAFTELRLTFVNPEDRVREGRFRITLPEQAAISRFAMRIDDEWQEAEVVERQKARQAYEDFLHRRQDPALLEKAAGNEFRARIFPIPAKGEKELILSYSQELANTNGQFRFSTQGLPQVEDFEVSVQLAKSGKAGHGILVQQQNFSPPGDLLLEGLQTADSLWDGEFLVTRVQPEADFQPQAPRKLLVLTDSSASRGLGFEAQNSRLEKLLKKLPGLKSVKVAAFDQSVQEVFQGKAKDFQAGKVTDRGAFGATDLAGALDWAGKQKGFDRLLLITDGVSTAGQSQLAESLKAASFERVDVLLVGGIRDRSKMELMVNESGFGGTVLDGKLELAELAHRLTESVISKLDVSVTGAKWTWPRAFENIQSGDERLVFARFEKGQETPIQLKLGERSLSVTGAKIPSSPLLSRAVVRAHISRLESLLSESTDPEESEELTELIIKLSTQHRVLSDKTALLVLETDADYDRFGIDRTALADILMVGKNGLELRKRTEVKVPLQAQVSNTKEEEKKLKDKSPGAPVSNEVETDLASPPPPPPEPSQDEVAETEAPADLRVSASVSSGANSPSRRPRPRASRPAPAREAGTLNRDVARPPSIAAEPMAAGDEDEEELAEERPAVKEKRESPLDGKYAEISTLLQENKITQALAKAQAWQKEEPGNVLAIVALGECLQAQRRFKEAARVFGSIIDLFPSRADLRRYAGSRLQGLEKEGLELAIDSFEKAVEQRPDHVSSHRYYAFALARANRYPEAVEALEAGLSRRYPNGRFRSYERILKDDLGLLCAAWVKKEPKVKAAVYKRLQKYDSKMAKEPSIRFILTWETDANDVDFHIYDNKKGHAYYSQPKLASGGELYGDVTTGYGPECFAIPGQAKAFPYELEIHYYSRGPMGYGMGQLEVLRHDGKGELSFEERPYVVMKDGAYVELGSVSD